MKSRIHRSVWLRVFVTAAILAYLASTLSMREAATALLRVDPVFLAATLALVAADRMVMIWRWVILLRSASVPVSAGSAAGIFLVSSFVGSFLPAGVGGDAARAYSLSRRTAQTSEAVASVAIDRLLGLVSIVLLGTAGVLLWFDRERALRGWSLSATMLVAAGSALVFWGDRVARAVLPDAREASGPIRRAALRFADALGRYRSRQAAVAAVLALSIGVQVLRVLQAYLLGRGLGLTVSFGYYLVFMPIGLLMLLLPVSISGFGLPQGVIVWLLRPVGAPDHLSFALSTLIVLTGLAGNLPGAWLYLRARKE